MIIQRKSTIVFTHVDIAGAYLRNMILELDIKDLICDFKETSRVADAYIRYDYANCRVILCE